MVGIGIQASLDGGSRDLALVGVASREVSRGRGGRIRRRLMAAHERSRHGKHSGLPQFAHSTVTFPYV